MRKRVLWGYSMDEYREMFDLSEEELQSKILEFGCGPSALNARQSPKGYQAVSCDPLFVLDKDTLSSKAKMIFAQMAEEVQQNAASFDFSAYGNMDALLAKRQQGMQAFFSDYDEGKQEGRYLGVVDYQLPFADFSFDLALVSHYLFADLENQHLDCHLNLLRELARVAKEVRVFPLIDVEGKTSDFLNPVLLALQKEGYGVEVREVAYHLHEAQNAMLRVWAQKCDV